MAEYSESLFPEDQARIFRFFATFARWECALKRDSRFVRAGSYGQAEVNWEAFADEVAGKLERMSVPSFVTSRDYLLNNPPHRFMFQSGWQPNPRRKQETDARYLFRVIRDVRNNLFHGGKYESVVIKELARDRALIDHSITVLNACGDLDSHIRAVLEEAA